MRVYIAGKITGAPAYREKFESVATRLPELGYEPINPAQLSLPASCAWDDYMQVTLKLLDLAAAICLLPDWKTSPGACVEYGYALATGKAIFYAEQLLAEPTAVPAPGPNAEEFPPPEKTGKITVLEESRKTCPVCGKMFSTSGRKIYCTPECRVAANRIKLQKKAAQDKKNKPLAGINAEDPVKDCPKDCRYLGKGTCIKTCDYLITTGKSRDCEVRPGGCDRYEKMQNGRRANEKL